MGAAFQSGHRETSRVAEDIQHLLPFGQLPHQLAVLTLVEEKSRFLAVLPVDMIAAIVFQQVFFDMFPQQVTIVNGIFLAHATHRFGAFVVNGLQFQIRYQLQSPDNLFQMQCHAFCLRLYHGGVSVNIDDEPWKAIALRMGQTIAIGVGIAHQTHATPYLKGALQLVQKEPLVDLAVVETQ